MVDIPDRLRCLYSTTLERRGDSYVLEVPREELDRGELTSGKTYRVAILPQPETQLGTKAKETQRRQSTPSKETEPTLPVEEDEVREVTIESLGDQGDGIAKVERGYVVIVPETCPDDEVTIEIEQMRENVAFARVRDDIDSDDSSEFDDSFAEETLGEGE